MRDRQLRPSADGPQPAIGHSPVPPRWWWVLPPIKIAAGVGLVAGIWVPLLGLVTSFALVAYFVVALGAHVRVRDVGRTLFLNASPMLLICIGAIGLSFAV